VESYTVGPHVYQMELTGEGEGEVGKWEVEEINTGELERELWREIV